MQKERRLLVAEQKMKSTVQGGEYPFAIDVKGESIEKGGDFKKRDLQEEVNLDQRGSLL
jgi:hypothetical protein